MTLFDKLNNVGLPVISADESGAVSIGAMTNEQMATFRDILFEHFHPVEYALFVLARDRQNAAKPFANSIPNWASWTQADWTSHFDTNLSDSEVDLVTSLTTARVMLKRQNLVLQYLVKLIIAMRDQIWPDLPEP